MGKKEDDQQYSEKETARRRDEWLRRTLNSPPKPHVDVIKERKAERHERRRSGPGPTKKSGK